MEYNTDTRFLSKDPYRGRGTVYLHNKNEKSDDDRYNPTGAVVVPISLATTFQQRTPGQATAVGDPNSFGMGYEYSRTGNPTRGAFERAVAGAENAKYCVAFASGSAATSAVIHLLAQGDHILCVDDVYGKYPYDKLMKVTFYGMNGIIIGSSLKLQTHLRRNTTVLSTNRKPTNGNQS